MNIENITKSLISLDKRIQDLKKSPEDNMKILNGSDPDEEFEFSLNNSYEVSLFIALAKKHNFTPYRYSKQKKTKVFIEGNPTYIKDVFWSEYMEIGLMLQDILNNITFDTISNSLNIDDISIVVKNKTK